MIFITALGVVLGASATAQQKPSCRDLAQKKDSNSIIRTLACQLEEENKIHCANKPPNQPCGKVFVASLPSKVREAHFEGRIIDVASSGQVAGACGAVATIMLKTKGAPPPVAYAGGAVATYNCDAWLRAAARRDPIVIFGPQAVVFKEMTGDSMKIAQKVADEVKRNIPVTALAGNVVVPIFQYNAVSEILKEKKVASLPAVSLDPEATLRNIQNAPQAIADGVSHAVEEVKKLCPICH
jgi:hypothetical protein